MNNNENNELEHQIWQELNKVIVTVALEMKNPSIS